MNGDLAIGDRVVLVHVRPYLIGSSNPAVGSQWGCEGTVSFIEEGHGCVKVQWDNGSANWYLKTYSNLEKADTPLTLPV